MELINFTRIKRNSYYRGASTYDFNELFLQLLIFKEENNGTFPGPLQLIKILKDRSGYGLKDTKDFYDLFRDLKLIDSQTRTISKYIDEINSFSDIKYMVENELNIIHFLRLKKLNKIKSNILTKS